MLSSTYDDWISYWAKRSPENVAVVVPRGVIRCAEFDAQINKVAARLGALGLPTGVRASVSITNERLHWLMLLALRPNDSILDIVRPALVLTDRDPAAEMAWRTVKVSKVWFEETMRQPPVARRISSSRSARCSLWCAARLR